MTPNINSLFPENCKHEMLFTQRELYLTRGQGIVKWNGCESSSLASVMKKPWEGWMTTPFKDVTTQETATAPGNLAADLVFVSFEKVQLLLCHLECQVLTPRGGRDIECSSKTLSSPHRMQSARLLCSVSERATNFTVQKLFVQPETGIQEQFSAHTSWYTEVCLDRKNVTEATTSPRAIEKCSNVITKWGITAISCWSSHAATPVTQRTAATAQSILAVTEHLKVKKNKIAAALCFERFYRVQLSASEDGCSNCLQ